MRFALLASLQLDPANHKSVTELRAERATKAKEASTVESNAHGMDLDVEFDGDVADEDDEGNEQDEAGAGDTDSGIEDSDEEDDSHEAQIARAAARRQQLNGKQKGDGESDKKGASITDLRIKLQKRIAELQAQRKQPPVNGSAGGVNGKGGANDDDEGEAGDTSNMSAKSDLLLERRRQRGEMRDRRRRDRKEARRREKDEAAQAAKGKGKKAVGATANGAQAGGKTAGAGPSAPGLIVPDASRSGKTSDAAASSSALPFGVSAEAPSFTFNNISFAGPGEEEEEAARKRKHSKHVLPRDPRSALQVLEARKAREEKRKAKAINDGGASSGAETEGVRKSDEDGVLRSDDATKWSKMLEATSGIKIRDDERMLKKAIKKKDKMKEKSKADW